MRIAAPARLSTRAMSIKRSSRRWTVRLLTPSCVAIDLSGMPATTSDNSNRSGSSAAPSGNSGVARSQ
jgi:hypothetical protein